MAIHSNRKYKVIYSFLIIFPLNPETIPSFHFPVSRLSLDQLRLERWKNRNDPDSSRDGPIRENTGLMRFLHNMMENQ